MCVYGCDVTVLVCIAHSNAPACGFVSNNLFAKVMRSTTNMAIHWLTMIPFLVPPHCRSIEDNVNFIDYHKFLETFSVSTPTASEGGTGSSTPPPEEFSPVASPRLALQSSEGDANGFVPASDINLIESLYAQHKQMSTVFNFFDIDGSGYIWASEFLKSCESLNKVITKQEDQIENASAIMDLMDLAGNFRVSANEFFEVFRIVDINDGALGTSPIDRRSAKLVSMNKVGSNRNARKATQPSVDTSDVQLARLE